MTVAHMALFLAAALALLLIGGAARRSRRRTLRVRYLTDLSNSTVDPDWPRYKADLRNDIPRRTDSNGGHS